MYFGALMAIYFVPEPVRVIVRLSSGGGFGGTPGLNPDLRSKIPVFPRECFAYLQRRRTRIHLTPIFSSTRLRAITFPEAET